MSACDLFAEALRGNLSAWPPKNLQVQDEDDSPILLQVRQLLTLAWKILHQKHILSAFLLR
jgi:hypothetical protein